MILYKLQIFERETEQIVSREIIVDRGEAEVDNVFQGVAMSPSPSLIYVIYLIILNVPFSHFVHEIICYRSEFFIYFI